MLLTTKLNLISGIVFGTAGLIVIKQMCKRKRCKKHQESHTPVATSD